MASHTWVVSRSCGNNSLSAVRTAELYQSDAITWTVSGKINMARTAREAALLANGEVLVAGGYNGTVLTNAERYNPATGTWTATGALLQARLSHAQTLLAK